MTALRFFLRPDYGSDPAAYYPAVPARIAELVFAPLPVITINPGTGSTRSRVLARFLAMIALVLAVMTDLYAMAGGLLRILFAVGVILVLLLAISLWRKPAGWPPSKTVDPLRMVGFASVLAALLGIAALQPGPLEFADRATAIVATAVGAAALAAGILDVYFRGYESWWWFTTGMINTIGPGRIDYAFTWDQVETLVYKAREVSTPEMGSYRIRRYETYELTVTGRRTLYIELEGGGGPPVLGDRDGGTPHLLSNPIAESITTAQVARFQPRVEAGDTVEFGPYAVSSAGLVVGSGTVVHWTRVVDVYLAYRSDRVFYNELAEVVERDCYFCVTVLAPAGKDDPDVWGASRVPGWPGVADPAPGAETEHGGETKRVRVTSRAGDVPNLGALRALVRAHAGLDAPAPE